MNLAERVGQAFDRLLAAPVRARLGLAVSGGGDSMALMHLAARWAETRGGCTLHVVTVDHGLRPEGPLEARTVARAAAALGLDHATLRWQGWDGRGNLQDAAARARRRLIADWAAGHGIAAVATGHTRDDQAETVLLRLARGSGVDGLVGIEPHRMIAGIDWLRPLLDESREDLRAWLTAEGVAWVEDPSNEDPRFDRVRARAMLASLAGLGLTPERLAATARHMARAREVLDAAAVALAQATVRQRAGALFIDAGRFSAAAEETRHRLLAAALMWVSGARYRPRHAALAALAESLEGTLLGAQLSRAGDTVIVAREPAAVAGQRAPAPGLWDGRWRLDGPGEPGLEIGALGAAGLDQAPGWRDTGLPRAALLPGPAIWRGSTLVAAPLAGLSAGWRATLVPPRDDFVQAPIMR